MKRYLLSLLLVLCAGLQVRAQEDEEEAWPEAFSKHLKGSIGDKLGIEMQLQAEPGTEVFFSGTRQFRGHYWYAHKRIPIDLFGDESSDGKVKLEEQSWVGGETGWDTTGIFNGEFNLDGTFTGTWSDKEGKKKIPFKLSAYQPAGAVKVKGYSLFSTWSERTAEGTASLEHTAFVVQVTEESPAAEKINQSLLKHAQAFFAEGEADEDAERKEEDKDKVEEEEALTLDSISEALIAERDDDLILDSQKWSTTYTSGVELNEHGILVTSHLMGQYTGGAHPNSITEFYVFDTKTGEEIKIESLFKPGFFESLPKLATEKLRKQEGFDAKKDEPGPTIETLDFEAGDPSWFLSAAGLVLHFDPYAIASYARGNVQLTIPWVELAPSLAEGSPLKKFVPAKK